MEVCITLLKWLDVMVDELLKFKRSCCQCAICMNNTFVEMNR